MKRKYKYCLIILLTELSVVTVLDKANIQLQSIWANAIGALLFLIPLATLFILMSKDKDFSNKKRVAFKFIYCWLIFCYIAGLLAKIFFE